MDCSLKNYDTVDNRFVPSAPVLEARNIVVAIARIFMKLPRESIDNADFSAPKNRISDRNVPHLGVVVP